MRYRPFGRTGLYVSELCLGTMTFGGKGFWEVIGKLGTSVIIGAKTREQLADNLAASDVRLDSEHVARLDAASALPPEYPGWMLERQSQDRRPPTGP